MINLALKIFGCILVAVFFLIVGLIVIAVVHNTLYSRWPKYRKWTDELCPPRED